MVESMYKKTHKNTACEGIPTLYPTPVGGTPTHCTVPHPCELKGTCDREGTHTYCRVSQDSSWARWSTGGHGSPPEACCAKWVAPAVGGGRSSLNSQTHPTQTANSSRASCDWIYAREGNESWKRGGGHTQGGDGGSRGGGRKSRQG